METRPILKEKLLLDSEVPLYSQLIGIIKRAIASGEAGVGTLLPSEAELCGAFRISRNTVRQAIGALEEDGYVVRKRGKGTFVADPAMRRKHVEYSFTTEISQQGKMPSSTVVDFCVMPAAPHIRDIMGLGMDERVYRFTRVRNVDGIPLIVETSYYPESIYPNLTQEMVQTHSFYSLLYHVGVVPFSAEDTYEAVLLGDREAALLDCKSGVPAFFHQRRTTNENGRIYEYTTSYMRADRVKLDVRFQKGVTEFTRVVDQ
jgi:GntR family transcriptional regulator